MPMQKGFRPLWLDAGYTDLSSEMSSAEVCKPPPAEFVRVYHFMSADHALSSIALGRLKLARFENINDPFELLALRLKGAHARNVMETYKRDLDRREGILCFSRNWSSPVLWSHYANGHKGVCLGFNLRRTLGEEVKYQGERILAKLDAAKHVAHLTDDQKIIFRKTKYSHWSYEKEIRVFVELESATKEGGLHFRCFDADISLAEVVVGANCNLDVEQVRGFTTRIHPNVVVFKARLAVKKFRIGPKKESVP